MKNCFFKYKDDGDGTIQSRLLAKTSLYEDLEIHEDVVPADKIIGIEGWKYGYAEVSDAVPDRRLAACQGIACDILSSKSMRCLSSQEFMSEMANHTTLVESAPGAYVLDGKEIQIIQ
jgi:hypothetical protein